MNIREIRQAYPQYNNLSDKQLADALHDKYYASMPVDEFYRRVGLETSASTNIGDILTAGKVGALGSVKALTDIFGANNVASAALRQKIEAAQKEYTPARQAELAREEAEREQASKAGLFEEAKVFGRQVLESPLQSAASAVGSFAPYLPSMLLGGIAKMVGLAPKAVAAAEAVANAAPKYLGTAQGAGAVKGAMYDAVYKAERDSGASEADARAKATEAQDYFGKNVDQIVLGGGLGRVAGGSGIERLLTPGGARQASTALLPRVGRTIAEEVATEAPQGAQEQFAQNVALQRTGRDVPLSQGVLGAAVQEGMMAALGAGPIAALRGGPAADLERQRRLEDQTRRTAELQAEERRQQEERARYRQTPEYLDDIQKRYDALVQQETQLTEATKVKPEGKDPASIEIANRAKKEASERLREFKQSDDYQATLEEYIQARPLLSGRIQAQARAEEAFGKQPLYEPEDLSPAAQAKKLQDRINELRKQQDKLATPAEKQPLENQIYDLEQSLAPYALSDEEYRLAESKLKGLLDGTPEQKQKDFGTIPAREGLREKLQKATSNADLQRIAAEIARVETAQRELEKLKPFVKTVTKQPSVFELRDQVDKAQAKGDIEALQRLTPMLAEAEKQPDLFEVARAEDLERGKLQEEIEAGRKEAEKQRLRVQAEIDSLRSIRDKIKERTARGMTAELWREELAKQQNRRYQSARNDYNRIKKATEELAALEKQKADAAAIDLKRNELQALTELSRRNADNLDALLKLQTERGKLVSQKAEADALAAKDAEIKAVQDRMQAEADAIDKEKTLRQSLALLQQQRASKDAIAAKQKEIDEVMLRPVTQTELGKPRKKGEVQPSFRKPYEDLRPYEERALEREANVEESDKRVDALLNNLLGMFTGTEKEKAPMFDIEAQKKAALEISERKAEPEEKRPPQARREAPIEQAANLLERKRDLQSLLDNYNAEIQKESRLPNLEKIQEKIDKATTAASKERHEAAYKAATEKIARVNDLKELRDFTAQELEVVTKRYNRLVELQTPGYEAARAEATTADLFGPLEEARTTQQDIQDELDKLYERRDQIKAELQRRGKVGETPAMQALVEQYSKDTPLLRATEAAIEQLEQDLKLATGKTSARYDAFVAAREQERAPEAEDRRTRTLPGFERRAGVRPVDPAQLAEARTELVALQNTEQQLKRALASADVDPTRMLREVAARKQNELNRYLVLTKDPVTRDIKKYPAEVINRIVLSLEKEGLVPSDTPPSAAVRNAMDTLRAEVKYFSNVIKGRNRKAIQNALTETQKRQDAVRGRIDELERRQRAYEQQEAVRTGAAPGTVEAQRLIEGGGYRTATGEIRTKPKALASWGITEITKKNATPAAPAKVAATSNMLRQYQKETAEAATASAAAKETLERQLNRATKNLTNLTNALEQVYPESVATTTDEEINKLLSAGLTPEQSASMRDMAQVYANLKNSVAGNTVADVVARLEAEKARIEREQGQLAGRRGSVAEEKELKKRTNTIQTQLNELGELIRQLKATPGKADPWTTSFNALIAESNAKALIAAQNLSYAQYPLERVEERITAFIKQAQENVDAINKEPDSPSKNLRLSNARELLDRATQRLTVNNTAFNADLERAAQYGAEIDAVQAAYQIARLEQLNLLRAYGQDLQRTIAVEAERIKSLTPQLEAQAKATAEADKKLKKAEQLLSAARVAERKKAEAPAPTPPDVYTQAEREALGRIREGVGLSGTQYTRDTTSRLVTLTKKTIRDTLNLRQAELNTLQAQVEAAKRRLAAAQAEQSDAVREGKPRDIEVADSRVQNALRDLNEVEVANRDQVQDLTQKVQELERAYEAVYDLGERKVTGVGEEAYTDLTAAPESPFAAAKRYFPELEAAGMAPVEGERLPRRRVGPVTRVGTQPPGQMLSGTAESREAISKGNRPAQAGRVRLTAADLDLQKASSVNLAVLKQQLDAATGDRKTQLQAAYNEAANGLSDEQVKDKIKEGNDLIKLPGAAAVVAARERVRGAWADLQKAESDLKEAKTPAAKEVAKDARDNAYQAWELSEAKLEQAQAAVASGVELTDTPKKTVEVAVDDALVKKAKKRGRRGAAEAIEDVYADEEGGPELGTTFRMEEQTLATDAAMNYMKLGQVQSAIEQLTADGTTDLIRQSAKDLLPFLKDVKVKFDRNLTLADGREVPAAYDPTTNTMYFRPSELTEENIIHEGTHAATIAVLTLPDSQLTDRQRNAKKELEAIFKRLKKDTALDQEYGLTDIKEFVSEVQSNEGFRAAIDQMPWYKRLWNAILRLIGKEPMEALSKRAERFVKEIYTESRPIAAPTVGAAPTSSIVGREAGTFDTLKGNLFGLAGRVQFFDRLGAADEALVRAKNAGALSDLEAFQTQYYLRLSDMTTQAAGQFMTSGPVKIVAEDVGGMKEYRYESQSGPTLINVSEYMEQAAKAGLGTPEKVETMLTVLIAGDRANALSDGWKRLAGDKAAAAKAEYDLYRQELRANPQAAQFIEAAKAEYKRYNDGLLDFAEQTGFLSPEEVRGLKRMPYVPFYRIQNGEVRLFTDKETSIRIGNIKDNPDLQRLIGDNKEILPILTSAAQNTFMLTRMGLRNKATQETANALFKAGFVSAIDRGMGPANPNTVHYKIRGEHHFAVIDSDQFGIPADLIVKGMEGIKTTIPGLVRAMGVPADWVRKFVTRSPAYVLRQLMRDPVNAAIIGGVDGVPVMNALKQMAQMRAGLSPEAEALQRGLVVNSNVFTGDERDMEVFMRSIATGRGKWAKMMSEFDKLALQADAATRATIYEDSIGKGLSKARASFRALEAQNFSRRGLSPTMQALNTIVPFFNAQLQGLDVLYRSLTNKMPFAEQLEIRKKLVTRGLMLAATAMTYALFMQNDDEYKKLEPEVRYGNFLIKTPFFKDFLAIPIPYEIGILFKALPEMLIDMASKDTAAKDAAFGLGKLLWQSAPSVIPAMPKPFLEAAYGQTQFGPIESEREKKLPAAQRARETTPEVLKMVGGITGAVDVSPLMLEHFLRAYTGALGLSILRLPDPLLRPAGEGEKASLRESQYPLVGGLFKSTEGRFLVDRAYARMQEIEQAVNGYEDLMKRGKRAEAAEFAQRKANLMAAEEMAGAFRKSVGEAYKDEREIRAAPNLTQAQKDKLIEQIRKARNLEAEGFYKATEKFRSAPLRPGA